MKTAKEALRETTTEVLNRFFTGAPHFLEAIDEDKLFALGLRQGARDLPAEVFIDLKEFFSRFDLKTLEGMREALEALDAYAVGLRVDMGEDDWASLTYLQHAGILLNDMLYAFSFEDKVFAQLYELLSKVAADIELFDPQYEPGLNYINEQFGMFRKEPREDY